MPAAAEVYSAFALVSPWYNLAFVVIVLVLFYYLFKIPNKSLYHKPWQLLFAAVCIFVVENILVILRGANILAFPRFILPIMEMVIIGLFIYMLLLQRDHVIKKGY